MVPSIWPNSASFGAKLSHRHGSLVGTTEIPIPRMVRNEPVIISRKAIENPVRGRHVRVIVGTVCCFRCLLVPAGPCFPVEVASVEAGRHLVGLVIKEALAHAVLAFAFLKLEAAVDDPVDEFLDFADFFSVGFAELFHNCSQPGAGTPLIAKARDPHAAVLHDDFASFAIVGHHGGSAMKRIFRSVNHCFVVRKWPMSATASASGLVIK